MSTKQLKLISTLPPSMIDYFLKEQKLEAKATLIGQHIELKDLSSHANHRTEVLITQVNETSLAFIYRYGAIVTFHASASDISELIAYCQPHTNELCEKPETEKLTVKIDSSCLEGIAQDIIYINQLTKDHLELIANTLSKSVILDLYENKISSLFRDVDPIANSLMKTGKLGAKAKELLQHIGSTLLMSHNMVGKVEVSEKPNLLWKQTHLEPLYEHLINDLELREREEILHQKMELISKTAETSLGVLEHRHSSRLEWYIIILIMIEIGLQSYELFFKNWLHS